MKNALLLLVIFMAVLSAKCAPSFQDGLPESITPVSAKYFPGAQMRHLIDSVTEINFTGKGMPESTYFERYAQFKTEYVKRLVPQLTKEFKTAEGIYNYGIPSAGDAAFRNGKMRLEYIYKINTVVYDIIHSSDHYFDRYMTFNTTERIMDFHSKVNVLASGEVQVAETIQIYTGGSENDRIRHGLVRNFPVDYKHTAGFVSSVPWHITSATLDGRAVPLNMKKNGADQDLYVGDPNNEIEPGIHTFVINYNTSQQVRHYKDYDEVAWNATGSRWHFPIENAACDITLPSGVQIHNTNCHTGVSGSTETNCSFQQSAPNVYSFKSNGTLQPGQGLTVSVSFNKGIVAATSTAAGFMLFMQDNKYFVWLVILLLVQGFLLAYVFTNFKVIARDIKVLYSPPAGLTAPEMGYIDKRAYSNSLFAAAMVEASISKYITLKVIKGSGDHNNYELRKAGRTIGSYQFILASHC